MNKNLIFRIIGIIGGLLVIGCIFLPYINSISLWKIYTINKQIYFTIAIMAFALLPIVLFAINKKTEFSYTSVGALLVFLLTNIVDVIADNSFNTLSIGFYGILVGTILIAISTFIIDKGSKVKTLKGQISPINNDIADITKRNSLENNEENISNLDTVSLANRLADREETNNAEVSPVQVDDGTIEPIQSTSDFDSEIPDFNPSGGINPVTSEFVSQNGESLGNESQNDFSTVPINFNENNEVIESSFVPDSSENASINPALELANDMGIPVSEVKSDDTVQQNVDSNNISIIPQEEIKFDQPEVTNTQEPQIDIFGQPK